MRRVVCSEETRASCPLAQSGRACFEDTHHLQYPKRAYRTEVEAEWRELPINKVRICRALHDALHTTGYVPQKPPRDVMVDEIWNGESVRTYAEFDKQIELGRLALERQTEGGDAA
ncbi:MAG TPA: hypothetical protein VGN15_11880 [Ktedonobacteraceae bacterium]|nr:hypothetical protein [Ktedonobacteraceae bacterium]